MNHTTRFFNGTRDGSPYQGRVTKHISRPSSESPTARGYFIVEVVIFDRADGLPHYSFERNYYDVDDGMREALRKVIANPDNY